MSPANAPPAESTRRPARCLNAIRRPAEKNNKPWAVKMQLAASQWRDQSAASNGVPRASATLDQKAADVLVPRALHSANAARRRPKIETGIPIARMGSPHPGYYAMTRLDVFPQSNFLPVRRDSDSAAILSFGVAVGNLPASASTRLAMAAPLVG